MKDYGLLILLLALILPAVYRREKAGDRLTALHVVLVILVLDTGLFPQGGTSTGIFVLPINNRTTGILLLLIPLLLLTRWLSGTARLRFTFAGCAWVAFFGWYLAAFVHGYLGGNDHHAAVQEGKMVVLLGGTALLVAGTPARDLIGRHGIPRIVRWAAPLAAVLTVTSLAGLKSHASFWLFTGVGTGVLGADVASVFASLGLLGLAVSLAAPRRHRGGMIASGVLIIAPVFTGQRASLLGVLAGGLFLVLWPILSRHATMRFSAKEKVAMLLAVLAVAGGLSLAGAADHGYDIGSSQVATSFNSAGKADSAQSRKNQWKVSSGLIAQKPVLGWGLGKRYSHIEKIEDAPAVVQNNDLTHDIFLDILLRSGMIGLFFLLVALSSTAIAGLRAVYRHLSPRIGALGVAGTALMVEMITRGSVESIFEKERLAILLGAAVGICCASCRSTRTRRAASSPSGEPLVVPVEWLPELTSAGSHSFVGTGSVPQKNT